jgi:hypothetical protein
MTKRRAAWIVGGIVVGVAIRLALSFPAYPRFVFTNPAGLLLICGFLGRVGAKLLRVK